MKRLQAHVLTAELLRSSRPQQGVCRDVQRDAISLHMPGNRLQTTAPAPGSLSGACERSGAIRGTAAPEVFGYFPPSACTGKDVWIGLEGDDLVAHNAGAALRQRWESKVLRDADPCGCWLWTGSLRADGYGQIMLIKGITWRAHRVGYLLRHGGLPEGLVLDHLCRVRACVNPDHLEPVTDAENKRRGVLARDDGHCPAGHPRTPENTYVKGSHRECRVCHRLRQRARREATR